MVVCFWGGSLFLSGAIKELLKGYIGFKFLISFSVLSILGFGIIDQVSGQNLSSGWAFVLMSLILMFANFIKAKEINSLQSSFKFMESLDKVGRNL